MNQICVGVRWWVSSSSSLFGSCSSCQGQTLTDCTDAVLSHGPSVSSHLWPFVEDVTESSRNFKDGEKFFIWIKFCMQPRQLNFHSLQRLVKPVVWQCWGEWLLTWTTAWYSTGVFVFRFILRLSEQMNHQLVLKSLFWYLELGSWSSRDFRTLLLRDFLPSPANTAGCNEVLVPDWVCAGGYDTDSRGCDFQTMVFSLSGVCVCVCEENRQLPLRAFSLM